MQSNINKATSPACYNKMSSLLWLLSVNYIIIQPVISTLTINVIILHIWTGLSADWLFYRITLVIENCDSLSKYRAGKDSCWTHKQNFMIVLAEQHVAMVMEK